MKYTTPEVELLAFAAIDVIMGSDADETDQHRLKGDDFDVADL